MGYILLINKVVEILGIFRACVWNSFVLELEQKFHGAVTFGLERLITMRSLPKVSYMCIP